MNYKYIALADFTANIDGEHKQFTYGEELVLPARHPELDLYINAKDVRMDNYKKPGYVPVGLVVCEEVEEEPKKDSSKSKNSKTK